MLFESHYGTFLDTIDNLGNLPYGQPRRAFTVEKVASVGNVGAVAYQAEEDDYCTYLFLDYDAPHPDSPTER